MSLAPAAAKLNLNGGYYFIQNNDTKHSALPVKEWLLYNEKSAAVSFPLNTCG